MDTFRIVDHFRRLRRTDRLRSAVHTTNGSGDADMAQERDVQISLFMPFYKRFLVRHFGELQGAALRDPHGHRAAGVFQRCDEPNALPRWIQDGLCGFWLFNVYPHELTHFWHVRFWSSCGVIKERRARQRLWSADVPSLIWDPNFCKLLDVGRCLEIGTFLAQFQRLGAVRRSCDFFFDVVG